MHKTQIEIRGVFWAVALVFSVFLVLPMALLLGKSFLVGGESGLGVACSRARDRLYPSMLRTFLSASSL